MTCIYPPLNFIENLLLDAGVSCEEVGTVLSHLLISLATYEKDKSKTNLTKITNDLFDCIQPKLSTDTNNLAENIGRTLIWLIINALCAYPTNNKCNEPPL